MSEFATSTFWLALVQIIGVDIVLSGDNAVVIALAARSLPPAQQRQAVIWGSGAAVLMRVCLIIVAVSLLKLPGLKLVGAALLLWIAVQLLVPEGEEVGHGTAASNLGGAIRTILLADLAMSLDNVLAIAAVAKGSIVLLILGLAVSIPLVVFTSTFLLKVMDRFPIIVTAGAGLLGYVAGEMMVTDIFTAPWIDENAHWLHTALPLTCAVLVIAVGKFLAARARARHGATPLVDIAAHDSSTRDPH